ncbi:MAG: transcriptional regulator [Ignavibacteria bacterium GWF2_33_9]|nr:MAG: transcriptional regulator [Ignavibacteria bacterium GWF2_33_9]
MNVPLLDLKLQYAQIQEEVEQEILRVSRSQMCILGKDVESFEENAAKYLGVKHAIGVSSGTDALLMGLMAYDIGPGDEVILPTFSFFATAGVVARTNATPIFVDSIANTYNIDPKAIAAKITEKTKAIIPVHLFGQAAEMDEIMAIAHKHNIPVIEDGAQSFGTQYKDGKFAGSIGEIGCFSFYPSKNLGAFGDGGLVTTNDDVLAEKLRQMRNHGMYPKYFHKFIGGNFRLDAIQAAVLNVKLKHLEDWHKARRKNADLYRKYAQKEGLEIANNVQNFINSNQIYLPEPIYAETGINNNHIYNQFTIRIARRDKIKDYLSANGIGSDIYYPVPFHRQECFSYLNNPDRDFPNANMLVSEVLSLPIFPELTEEQIAYTVEKLAEAINIT